MEKLGVDGIDILSLFHFDASVGRLYWRSPPKNHPKLLDTEAGAPRTDGCKRYWVIKINGKAWKRGALIFFLTHGRLPAPCLDHINGDSLDDRPDNLREATKQQNSWNIKARRRTKPLPMGVRHMGNKFQARIVKDGRMQYLGVYATPEEARAEYVAARERLFGEFA